MTDIADKLRQAGVGADGYRQVFNKTLLDGASEIWRLRAAISDIIKHMDAKGMGDWPVAKRAKKLLSDGQSGRKE